MKQETYTVIDSYELEQLVGEHLGDSDFNFVADVECGNDSEHALDLRVRPLSNGSELGWRKEIEEWEQRNYQSSYVRPRYYLAKLIEKGILPAEHPFLITVCW